MVGRRQQQRPGPIPSGPSALDSWVSSDSHFDPAAAPPLHTPSAPSSSNTAAPPPRPPLARAPTAASFLGFGRAASAAGNAPRSDNGPGGGRSASATATAFPAAYRSSDGGGDGSGGQGSWVRRPDGMPYLHAAAAAITAAIPPGRMSARGTAGSASPAASALPETPSLRSPEWSPRWTSGSPGSAPSPLLAVLAAPGAATTRTLLATGPRRRHATNTSSSSSAAGLQLLYTGCSGEGSTDSVYGSGIDGGGGGGDAEGVVWGIGSGLAGGRGWRAEPAGELPYEVSEAGWRSSGGGESSGGGGHVPYAPYLCRPAPSSSSAPVAGSAGGTPAAAAPPPPLGAEAGDLSLVLDTLGMVRCAANAARGRADPGAAAVATAAETVGRSSIQASIVISGLDEPGRHSEIENNSFAVLYDSGDGGAAAAAPPPPPLPRQCAGLSSTSADGAALTGAVAAAPTDVLLLVLVVRLFRAATRWPAAAALCAATAAVLATWLAAAAALLAAAVGTGRAAHLTTRAAWTVAAWCLQGGSRLPVGVPAVPRSCDR